MTYNHNYTRSNIFRPLSTQRPYGNPSSIEVEIASRIAQVMKLDYEVEAITTDDILKTWDNDYSTLIKQTDGMVSLFYLFTPQKLSTKLKLLMGGGGAEIARGVYLDNSFLLGRYRYTADNIQGLLMKRVLRNLQIVRPEAKEFSIAYINEFVAKSIEEGVAPIDVFDWFYLCEYVRRREGNQIRQTFPSNDSFHLFSTRPFLELVFSISARERYTAPIHYQIIKRLPELHKIIFDGNRAWSLQNPYLNLLDKYIKRKLHKMGYPINQSKKMAKAIKAFDRRSWLEANQGELFIKLRETCLDNWNSPVWNWVDRSLFESLTEYQSLEEFNIKNRVAIRFLFPVASLIYYSNSLVDT